MCGIAGIFHRDGRLVDPSVLTRMANAIVHRGPDDEGYFTDAHLGFAFRRLAILDLSPAGHQPMVSADGNLCIVFNGEIYNYLELREELKRLGFQFRSRSDTEVILAAYEAWGADCLRRFNGMWGMAIWDKRQRRLFCARDRFGVKPFYYIWNGGSFLFASEIKALMAVDDRPRKPDLVSLYNFLVIQRRDFSDRTFFDGVRQLEPGHYAVVSEEGMSLHRYYSLNINLDHAPDRPAERFLEIFRDSVRLRLRSDVPVGSCLSGGLDSSAVVCMMEQLLSADDGFTQKTFSACWEDPSVDERPYIDAVLAKTRIDGHRVFPTVEKLDVDLDRLLWHQEEPFGSTSIYAQYAVMQIAHEQGMKVLLDGQGADELLAGYNQSYLGYWASQLRHGRVWEIMKSMRALRATGKQIPAGYYITLLLSLLPKTTAVAWKNRMLERNTSLASREFGDTMRGALAASLDHDLREQTVSDFRMILRSLLSYEDKNSMAFSIETRLPFLDVRLVEYVLALPELQKIRNGVRKHVLREALKGVIPHSILGRKDKIGFATPESAWQKEGPLRERMRAIFHSTSFLQRPYFDGPRVRDEFDQLQQRPSSITFLLPFVCELWFRRWIDSNQPV